MGKKATGRWVYNPGPDVKKMRAAYQQAIQEAHRLATKRQVVALQIDSLELHAADLERLETSKYHEAEQLRLAIEEVSPRNKRFDVVIRRAGK